MKKIAIELPKECNCRKCCCFVETRAQIGGRIVSFYLCRAFNRILESYCGTKEPIARRCSECYKAELPTAGKEFIGERSE